VFSAVEDAAIFGVTVGRHLVLLPLWGLVATLGVVSAVRAGGRLPAITKVLNTVASILVVSNLVTVAWFEIQSDVTETNVASDILRIQPNPGVDVLDLPDVYYIIFDRYAGGRALKDLFRFDNSPFLDFLRSKGFFVADQSTTNYPRTAHSLASSLNLNYLDQLVTVDGPSGDWAPIVDLIQNDAVPKFLKERGYTYIHVGSRWRPTSTNPQADANISMGGGLSEFATTILGTTAFDPLGAEFTDNFNFEKREFLRVLFEFDQLVKSKSVRGPKFVFGHILLPHEPFIFDRNGNYVDEDVRKSRTRHQNYLEQLRFANKKITELVNVLRSGPPSSQPIIILQSDEGAFDPFTSSVGVGPDTLERKFGILNAYYFPGVQNPALYPSITPVNSFRVVFNTYFGTRLPLLPDRNFVFQDLGHLYTFTDVTDQITR
jgi:hypothetical protein